MEKAQKLRGQILTRHSQAAQLVAGIKAEVPDWRFAHNPQNVGELDSWAFAIVHERVWV